MSPQLIVIMGVSGSGKSTVAAALSDKTGWPFLEGDDFHPPSNIEKMTSGTPLTHADRIPWIDAIGKAVHDYGAPTLILSCSALNAAVRHRLTAQCRRTVKWIYLEMSRTELLRRLQTRTDHFMQAALLDSQLAALSPPLNAVHINGEGSLDFILTDIIEKLLRGKSGA